LLVKDWRRR